MPDPFEPVLRPHFDAWNNSSLPQLERDEHKAVHDALTKLKDEVLQILADYEKEFPQLKAKYEAVAKPARDKLVALEVSLNDPCLTRSINDRTKQLYTRMNRIYDANPAACAATDEAGILVDLKKRIAEKMREFDGKKHLGEEPGETIGRLKKAKSIYADLVKKWQAILDTVNILDTEAQQSDPRTGQRKRVAACVYASVLNLRLFEPRDPAPFKTLLTQAWLRFADEREQLRALRVELETARKKSEDETKKLEDDEKNGIKNIIEDFIAQL